MTNNKGSTIAKKKWGKQAESIEGEGRYAVLARCGLLTINLCPTIEEAEEQKRFIDEIGCGGRCSKRHEVVDLFGT
jgi:hypothetical protein